MEGLEELAGALLCTYVGVGLSVEAALSKNVVAVRSFSRSLSRAHTLLHSATRWSLP